MCDKVPQTYNRKVFQLHDCMNGHHFPGYEHQNCCVYQNGGGTDQLLLLSEGVYRGQRIVKHHPTMQAHTVDKGRAADTWPCIQAS